MMGISQGVVHFAERGVSPVGHNHLVVSHLMFGDDDIILSSPKSSSLPGFSFFQVSL